MKEVMIKDLKKGDFFTLKPIEEPHDFQVYIKGDYIRSDKKFECSKFTDFCDFKYYRSTKIVYTDFLF
nr:MAG TPA: hypothetical protein [Caudoviricetes sp.]